MDASTLELVALIALVLAAVSMLTCLVLAGKISSLRRRIESTGPGQFSSVSTSYPAAMQRGATTYRSTTTSPNGIHISASNVYRNATPSGMMGATTDMLNEAIVELVIAGKKIEAIKLYREVHGVGLKEAKDAVDKIG